MLRHPYDIPTFKTKALRLVSYEGRVKHLLLQYKWLMQPYVSLLWLNWQRISLLGPLLSTTLTVRVIKRN